MAGMCHWDMDTIAKRPTSSAVLKIVLFCMEMKGNFNMKKFVVKPLEFHVMHYNGVYIEYAMSLNGSYNIRFDSDGYYVCRGGYGRSPDFKDVGHSLEECKIACELDYQEYLSTSEFLEQLE